MRKRILADSDLVLQAFINTGHAREAEQLLEMAKSDNFQVCVTAQCLEQIRSELEKRESKQEIERIISWIQEILKVEYIEHIDGIDIDTIIKQVYKSGWKNLNSAVEAIIAIASEFDAIVTEKYEDFAFVDLPVLSVEDLFLFKPKLNPKRGVNCTKLIEFLAAKNWKKADQETLKIMLEMAGREQQGWLRYEDIEGLPHEDICVIDRLWKHYSDGHFGFSVQKDIYQNLKHDSRDNNRWELWQNFCNEVGWFEAGDWKCYNHLMFYSRAPKGHLPDGRLRHYAGEKSYSCLASKLVDVCYIELI